MTGQAYCWLQMSSFTIDSKAPTCPTMEKAISVAFTKWQITKMKKAAAAAVPTEKSQSGNNYIHLALFTRAEGRHRLGRGRGGVVEAHSCLPGNSAYLRHPRVHSLSRRKELGQASALSSSLLWKAPCPLLSDLETSAFLTGQGRAGQLPSPQKKLVHI